MAPWRHGWKFFWIYPPVIISRPPYILSYNNLRPPVIICRPPVNNSRPPVINWRLPHNNWWPRVINWSPPHNNWWSPVIIWWSLVIDRRPPHNNWWPRVINSSPPHNNWWPRVINQWPPYNNWWPPVIMWWSKDYNWRINSEIFSPISPGSFRNDVIWTFSLFVILMMGLSVLIWSVDNADYFRWSNMEHSFSYHVAHVWVPKELNILLRNGIERSWNHLWFHIDMQVFYNKLWLAELHNIVDSLKIALQPKRKWRRLVHYILNGIILGAKCCILVQISMTYDSKVQMTKCLRWFCLWFVFPTGDMLFLESTRMTTQFKNTCHEASVISYCFQAGSWYDHQGKSVLLMTRIGYIISSICLYIYHR